MKKICISVLLSLTVITSVLAIPVFAATDTRGVTISGNGYTWAIARLISYYNSSTRVISGANTERAYTYPLAKNVKNYVSYLSKYKATGYLKATVGGVTKDGSVTFVSKK